MSDDEEELNIHAVILLVTGICSLIGSSMLVLSCLAFSKGQGVARLVLYLGLADVGWSLIDVIAFSVLVHDHRFFNVFICKWSRVLYQFFGCAAVMWCASISIFLYRKFTVPKKPIPPEMHPLKAALKKNKSMIIYQCLSWGFPIVQGFVIYPYIEYHPHQLVCLPFQPYFTYFWFIPVSVPIFTSIIVYMMFIRATRKPSFNRTNFASQIPVRVFLYIFVMCICWIPDIIYYTIGDLHTRKPRIGFAVNGLLELQGCLDCLVYGLLNKDFRSHYKGVGGFLRAVFSPVLVFFALAKAFYSCVRPNKKPKRRVNGDTSTYDLLGPRSDL